MSLVVESRPAEWPDPRYAAGARVPAETEYHFLLGRFIDAATLARANVLAAKWGVHPHDVLIANGWLDADDYYKALAERCGDSGLRGDSREEQSAYTLCGKSWCNSA